MRRLTLLAAPAASLVLVGALAPAAIAATSGVVHRESVLTEVDATGATGVSRVFTQMTVPSGDEVVLRGQSLSALRALTGEAVADGEDVVFGPGLSRTVADNTAALPVSIEIRYAIDGTTVEPRDVVGHDGEVAVTYVVRNLTAEPTELTLVDGDGVESTQMVDVAVPMVGSLSMTLPAAFSDVVAPGAVVVGNGRGGTVVNWSLLLFAPLGSETQEVTWTADAVDAIVPEASLQVLPVTPDSFGSLGATERAYGGAVESTTALTEGAREIDANLQLLADGAGELLAGLTQLRDGAAELATGLVAASDGAGELSTGLSTARAGTGELNAGLGDLRDGAGQLSDGLATARAGAGELDSGLVTLAAGSSTVAAGLASLDAGARSLNGGLGQLSTGAAELATGVGALHAGATALDTNAGQLAVGARDLSAGATQLQAGVQQLSSSLQGSTGLPSALAGVDQLQAGVGAVGATGTLLDGLGRVSDGLVTAQQGIGSPSADGTARNGLARVAGGLSNPACDPANPANPANPCGVSQLNGSVASLSGGVLGDLQAVLGSLSGIDATVLSAADQGVLADALTTLGTNAIRAGTIQATAAGVATVVTQLQGGVTQVDNGLATLSGAIGDPTAADTLRNGVARITAGVSNPACDPANPSSPTNPCGLLQGLNLLEQGLTTAAAGVAAGLGSTSTPGTLLWGADQVAVGSGALSVGAGRLQAEGTRPLAAGAGRALDGADRLAAGSASAQAGGAQLGAGAQQLAEGGTALAAGAARAAAGSSSLADGLVRLDEGGRTLSAGTVRAADGGTALDDGLAKLDAGGQQLSEGLDTAADGGQQLADGLVSAADGGTQVGDGSQRLVDEGTSVLADTVAEATVSSSLQLEQVRAVAARGVAGDGLPYPTVDGATSSAVYQFTLAGVGAATGPGALGRVGLGALALAGAAGIGGITRGRRPGELSVLRAEEYAAV